MSIFLQRDNFFMFGSTTKLNDTHHKELNSINNISNVLRLTKTSGNISIYAYVTSGRECRKKSGQIQNSFSAFKKCLFVFL